MKRLVFLVLASGLATTFAQQGSSATRTSSVEAFAVRPPDETSPFFLDPVASARIARGGVETVRAENISAEYPRARGAENNAFEKVGGFFTKMFSSVNIGPIRQPPATSALTIEPTAFSLQDRREISVTYTIRNNTPRMMRVEYPTGQRIDILTKDASGNVVDKWSDDRTFAPDEGIVIINPQERIEYQEKIPTREMKPGQTYSVDAFATTEPAFPATGTVTPE